MGTAKPLIILPLLLLTTSYAAGQETVDTRIGSLFSTLLSYQAIPGQVLDLARH